MSDPNYENRFLSQHNIYATKSASTTPVKCRGDRFIPVRSPEEWSIKFASLQNQSPDVQSFARPLAASNVNSASTNSLNGSVASLPNNAGGGGASASAGAAASSGANGAPVLPSAAAAAASAASSTTPGGAAAAATSSANGVTPTRVTPRAEDQRQDNAAFKALLKNEILGCEINDIRMEQPGFSGTIASSSRRSLFQYSSLPKSPIKNDRILASPYSLSPLSPSSEKLLKSPRKAARKIPRVPYKVLDAPELQDDFYLNLVDWSAKNILSVGLASSVYLWSACTSQVTKLCDLSASDNDSVTSVSWCEKGDTLAVGTQRGLCQIYDVATQKRLLTLEGHTSRVGCLAWNGDLICTGSRDRLILQRDIRSPPLFTEKRLTAHRQEVCGLKWSPDHQYLASGGNDNQLLVWSLRSQKPVQAYCQHVAAVKAIAWSPHHHGLLVSGGGTADRCMKFWNTLTGQPMHSIDAGSQVCNIAWSKHSCELVSTHGYSQNQIVVWQYPSLQQVVKLTGHSFRVLYLAMSPDGESIVTGAGDETLRFWRVFSKQRCHREIRSSLNLFTSIR